MKKTISVVLLMAMSFLTLTSCGGSGTVETENKKYMKGSGSTGPGYVYVFDIDKTSSYTVDSHKNLISIYNYDGLKNDAIYFSDVYISRDTIEGNVILSKSTGFSGISGSYIPNNTSISVNDNNCYVKVGNAKKYLKNFKIKLLKVGQESKTNGKASFSFDWAQ